MNFTTPRHQSLQVGGMLVFMSKSGKVCLISLANSFTCVFVGLKCWLPPHPCFLGGGGLIQLGSSQLFCQFLEILFGLHSCLYGVDLKHCKIILFKHEWTIYLQNIIYKKSKHSLFKFSCKYEAGTELIILFTNWLCCF